MVKMPPVSKHLARHTFSQSKGFAKKGIEKINKSAQAYVYLFLTSQIQTRSIIAGNPGSAMKAQHVFKSTFDALINKNYSIGIDIESYLGVSGQPISKADF